MIALAGVLVAAVTVAVAWHAGRRSAAADLAVASSDLDAARDRLDADRQRMVATVSHELRTPLTVIQGIVSTLSRHWTDLSEPARLDLIDAITENVASLDSSILHFIDIGRLERGDVELEPTEVAVAPVIEAAVAKLGAAVAGYDVRIQLDREDAYADPAALGRIVELLVANAARFSPLASVIHIHVRPDGPGIELAVGDRGMGIPPGHLAHVFEPLWRGETGETGISRGAGLGLSIVKELAERQGGSVRVVSSKGRGSTFYVTLPGPPVGNFPAENYHSRAAAS